MPKEITAQAGARATLNTARKLLRRYRSWWPEDDIRVQRQVERVERAVARLEELKSGRTAVSAAKEAGDDQPVPGAGDTP